MRQSLTLCMPARQLPCRSSYLQPQGREIYLCIVRQSSASPLARTATVHGRRRRSPLKSAGLLETSRCTIHQRHLYCCCISYSHSSRCFWIMRLDSLRSISLFICATMGMKRLSCSSRCSQTQIPLFFNYQSTPYGPASTWATPH